MRPRSISLMIYNSLIVALAAAFEEVPLLVVLRSVLADLQEPDVVSAGCADRDVIDGVEGHFAAQCFCNECLKDLSIRVGNIFSFKMYSISDGHDRPPKVGGNCLAPFFFDRLVYKISGKSQPR